MSKKNVSHDENANFDGAIDKNPKRPADKDVGDKNAATAERPADGIDGREQLMPKGLQRVREAVEKIFTGVEGLSEDFTEKAATILEAAFVEIQTEIAEQLTADFESKLAEQVAEREAELKEHAAGYLTDVVATFVAENKVAIQHTLKVEIAEQIMENIGASFASRGIDVSPEKIELADQLAEQVAEAEARAESLNASLSEANEVLVKYQRAEVIAEASKGLTDATKERFSKLAEQMEFTNSEQFGERLKIVKETVLGETVAPATVPANLNEDVNVIPEVTEPVSDISDNQRRFFELMQR